MTNSWLSVNINFHISYIEYNSNNETNSISIEQARAKQVLNSRKIPTIS